MNITREYIEQLSNVEPYCFETDREEQWFNIGLQYGLEAADANPKYWMSVEDKLPPVKKHGMSATVLAITAQGEIYFSKYNHNTDMWITPSSNPTFAHWMFLPGLPK